jgi:hypothetical protein
MKRSFRAASGNPRPDVPAGGIQISERGHTIMLVGSDSDVAYWLPKIIAMDAAREAAVDHADDPFLSTAEAAEAIGISRERVRQWCSLGYMGTLDVSLTRGGVWKMRRSELIKFWTQRHPAAPLPIGLRDEAA